MAAHLDYPCWCLLLAPQYPLCPNDTGIWVNGAVHDVDGHYMTAVLIRILVPHPNDNVRPGMAAYMRTDGQEWALW